MKALRYQPWKGFLLWGTFIALDVYLSIIISVWDRHDYGGMLAAIGFFIAWGWSTSRIGEDN